MTVDTMPEGQRSIARMGLAERLRLLAEIARTYPGALKSLRNDDLPTMVERAREVPVDQVRSLDARQQRDTAVRLGRAVTLTMRVVPTDSRCLVQALVLSRMLTRRGIETSLVVGVTPRPEFKAHAWLEHQGRAVQPPGHHSKLMEL